MNSLAQEFFQRLAGMGLYGCAQPCQFVRDGVLNLDVVTREAGPEPCRKANRKAAEQDVMWTGRLWYNIAKRQIRDRLRIRVLS